MLASSQQCPSPPSGALWQNRVAFQAHTRRALLSRLLPVVHAARPSGEQKIHNSEIKCTHRGAMQWQNSASVGAGMGASPPRRPPSASSL